MIEIKFDQETKKNVSGAAGDALILADVLVKDLSGGTLLDVGCGEGSVAINVACRRNDVTVLGIDIDNSTCITARSNVERTQIGKRVSIICANVFQTKLPFSDAVCSNPPLLPDEQCFSVDETQNLFWKALIEKINTEETSALIYLHLFDFHGINHKTGVQPSLEEVGKATDFEITNLYRGIRQIGNNSRVRYNFAQLAMIVPEGTIFVEDAEVPLYKFADIHPYTTRNLSISQSIVRLSRH